MAKILHTGDIHLGAKVTGLGKSGDKVRAALKDSFTKMIDICLESRVDAFVVAGDLFDSNRISKPLLDFAMREIGRLGDIPAIVIPGTHDCLEDNCLYSTLHANECPENLYLFNDPEKTKFTFSDKGLTFYASPNEGTRSKQSPLNGLTRDSSPGYHIAIAHGSLAIPGKSAPDDFPMEIDEIEGSGFDYVALGHWHSHMRAPTQRVPASYCGSPEPLSFKQTDAGFAAMVELAEGKVIVDKIQVGKLEWRTIELPCTSYKYTLELEREISKYVGENKLLKVILTGLFPADGYIDFDRLYEHMADSFLYLDLDNRSQSIPENLEEQNLPETTILGQYIKMLSADIKQEQDPEQQELLRNGLKLGYALLSGKDAI
ncbi:MAG: DNA repair exonuclease [candidate division Zixibacteria bacterium]|nr:DNA repair exonuclease [candidate division Zixibacteria bacterium]NIR63551.1 DNA repair exonuclease [candidate division Zixibacteria bacterium]NIS18042.1 DNA repair exonuclease [candidate division Zixibacteria bacterium]NIS45497.1 DNA repair exonuclease [candidate division Zixibacteria bacterium]NIT54322.1 DNA repair exonuclease [candidate division Zixibacteria bacterium]